MKRSIWTRALALLLVFFMLAPDAAAATNAGSRSSSWRNPWQSIWENIWDNFWGGSEEEPEETTPEQETEAAPEEEPEQTDPVTDESDATLVEDATTVDNGALLRASTYALSTSAETYATESTKVVYFPVTMFNYDETTMRQKTHQAEVEAGLKELWEGFYFSGGNPSATSYTYTTTAASHTDLTWAQVQAGTYYADEACTTLVAVEEVSEGGSLWNAVAVTSNTDYEEYPEYGEGNHYYNNSGTYELINGLTDAPVGWYVYTDKGGDWDYRYVSGSTITIYTKGGEVTGYTLTADGQTLATLDGTDLSGQVGITLYSAGGSQTVTKNYAAWNFWSYVSGTSDSQNKMYVGLVEDTLVDDQIRFTVPEAGIFNDDDQIKDIYRYVGLPFVLNENGYYSFNAEDNGVYFADNDGDGTADPGSGSIDEFGNITAYNLQFDEGQPQGWSGMNSEFGDGSTTLWAPFNTNSNDSGQGAIDYHFGMRADIPFSMTPNGRIKSTDDESDPITFTFSGDDDVWVFIDGHLVIDLGGIHNRLNATIDFANNTITYSENNNSAATFGCYNDADFQTVQKLFTDDEGTGIIPMTRDAFALDPDHEMQVFYLERGKGTSNCRIEFNLPMNDTVMVTKDATQSYTASKDEVDNLTAAEQAIVNNIDFGFTLYKKTAEEGAEFEPVANTNFYLVGRGVEGVVINQTDAEGHFYLKNGQSAKFITEIPADGVTYYVVEDQVPNGFVSPDFTFAGEATYDYSYTDGTTSGTAPAADAGQIPEQIIPMPQKDADGNYTNWAENKSYEVTVMGSVEANDSIEFICSNYLDAELPNPTALTYEDVIVLDYGLPVVIDPLANDVFRGDNIEIIYYGNETVTMEEIVGEDGVVNATYSGEQTFHSGNLVMNDVTYNVANDGTVTRDTFTYTMNNQLTEVEVITYVIKVTGQEKNESTGAVLTQNDFAIGKIYIVPATVMYYEENFNGLVSFLKSGTGYWEDATTPGSSAYQEPGVMGDTNDSIYGSDVAYLNDSQDSNGTSKHGNTAGGALRFQYTFTGTGTTIFARTSATSGYMQIKVYEGTATSGDYMSIYYRDTYYKDQNESAEDAAGTLYNIPVYTVDELDYGTYTVVVTVAKKGTPTEGNPDGAGEDFWLDGIRIMQPMNLDSDLIEKAQSAYAADGESNMDTITLRQKLIAEYEQDVDPEEGETESQWPFAVMTDIDGEIIYASDYIGIGPKEEVYLLPGQSVSFTVKYWHPNGYRMHMGMKAPFGNAVVQVGQQTFTLKNAADCYYDITGMQASVVTKTDADGNTYYLATYTFTAVDKIVSLTNIKITGYYEFTLDDNVDVEG